MRQVVQTFEEWFRRTFLIGTFFLLVVAIALSQDAVIDPDIGWHLRTAAWMLDSGTVPRTDPFSAYGQDRPWVAYSWLYDLFLYWTERQLGVMAAVVITTLMSVGIALVQLATVRRFSTNPVVVIGLTVLGMVAMGPVLRTPRPWLFSILFYLLELRILLDARDRGRHAAVWWLPVVFLAWANLHIQFVYGLVVFGVATLDFRRTGLIQSSSVRAVHNGFTYGRWLLLITLCISATLLTPYSIDLYRTLYEVIRQTGIYQSISEMRAMSFRHLSDWSALCLTVAAAYSMGRNKDSDLFLRILFVMGLFVSYRAARDIWFLMPVAVYLIASYVAKKNGGRPFTITGWQKAGALLVVMLGSVMLAKHRKVDEAELKSAVAKTYPESAVHFVKTHHYPGPLYNHFNWGGYLIWQLPEIPVSIDGRANLHGDERIDRSIKTWTGQRDWSEDKELNAAKLVIAGRDTALCSLLKLDSRFDLVYEDSVAAVFTRKEQSR